MPDRIRKAMGQFIQKAAVLVEALPYIREFEGKTVVIKYGGAAMEDPTLRQSTAEDIVLMKYVGMNPVVVHGGGPEISRRLKQMQILSEFRSGLRVTTDEAMEVVEMVLAGRINKEVVSLINRASGMAVGICGVDGDLLHAKQKTLPDGSDLGRVGDLTGVHFRVLSVLCEAGMIPVIAPVATDAEGGLWNINADTAAGEIAAAIQAEKIVFVTDTPGILQDKADPDSLISQLCYREILELEESGVIDGGMLPKVDACLKALDYGVSKAHIIDGRIPHSLLLEIFTVKGLGTLITH